MIYNIKLSDGNRTEIINFIKEMKKKNNTYTIIDIGGSANGWSSDIIDALVDIIEPNDNNNKYIYFKMDITDYDNYKEILDYVEKNGKFDFSICTHTLEDITNPVFVSKYISKISKEGYISFPSKYRELCRFEGNYRGYIHHRYIFSYEKNENKIIAFPKINYIENEKKFDIIGDMNINKYDLSFYWKDSIEIEYINNNYLGPTVNAVISYYDKLFD